MITTHRDDDSAAPERANGDPLQWRIPDCACEDAGKGGCRCEDDGTGAREWDGHGVSRRGAA